MGSFVAEESACAVLVGGLDTAPGRIKEGTKARGDENLCGVESSCYCLRIKRRDAKSLAHQSRVSLFLCPLFLRPGIAVGYE